MYFYISIFIAVSSKLRLAGRPLIEQILSKFKIPSSSQKLTMGYVLFNPKHFSHLFKIISGYTKLYLSLAKFRFF